jgi:hypothetical protein
VDEQTVGVIEGQKLAELLGGPFRGRMFSHVAMQNSARADLHRHEDIENPEIRGYRNEEIAGDDGLGVIILT